MEVHCSQDWQQLSGRCAYSHAPLVDPARGRTCAHLPMCNFKALESHASKSRECPVAGCNHRVGPRDLVRDDALREALKKIRRTQQPTKVWVRGNEVVLSDPATPPTVVCEVPKSTKADREVERHIAELRQLVDAEAGFSLVHMAILERCPIRVLRAVLAAEPGCELLTTDDGELPLHLAAREGAVDAVVELLAIHQDGALAADKWGDLPLHNAARDGHAAVLAALMRARPEAATRRNRHKKTPIELLPRRRGQQLQTCRAALLPQSDGSEVKRETEPASPRTSRRRRRGEEEEVVVVEEEEETRVKEEAPEEAPRRRSVVRRLLTEPPEEAEAEEEAPQPAKRPRQAARQKPADEAARVDRGYQIFLDKYTKQYHIAKTKNSGIKWQPEEAWRQLSDERRARWEQQQEQQEEHQEEHQEAEEMVKDEEQEEQEEEEEVVLVPEEDEDEDEVEVVEEDGAAAEEEEGGGEEEEADEAEADEMVKDEEPQAEEEQQDEEAEEAEEEAEEEEEDDEVQPQKKKKKKAKAKAKAKQAAQPKDAVAPSSVKGPAFSLAAGSEEAEQRQATRCLDRYKTLWKDLEADKPSRDELRAQGKQFYRADHEARRQMLDGGEAINQPAGWGAPRGVAVGTLFPDRASLVVLGVHKETMKGIAAGRCGKHNFGQAIVMSGRYENDAEVDSDRVEYTGEGKNDFLGSCLQVGDQELVRGNLALANCKGRGVPVRVVRKLRVGGKVQFRYEGLYTVESWRWERAGETGGAGGGAGSSAEHAKTATPLVVAFRLQRMGGQAQLSAARPIGFGDRERCEGSKKATKAAASAEESQQEREFAAFKAEEQRKMLSKAKREKTHHARISHAQYRKMFEAHTGKKLIDKKEKIEKKEKEKKVKKEKS